MKLKMKFLKKLLMMDSLKTSLSLLILVSSIGLVTPVAIAQSAPTSNPATEKIFQQGLDQLEAEDYQGAITAFNQVLQSNPEDVEAYYNRGLAHASLKDYEKAIADYTEVIKRTPNDVEAYYNRALAKIELQDDEGAIADYSMVIQRKPDDADAYYNRGISYAELNQDGRAITDLQKAIELFTKQGKIKEAQEVQDVIRKLQPTS